MIHYTKLGRNGDVMRRFADKSGMLPQKGDSIEAFSYPDGWFDAVWIASAGIDAHTSEARMIREASWNAFIEEVEFNIEELLVWDSGWG